MPHTPPASAIHALIPNVWTVLEEAWVDGFSDTNRALFVPPGLVVSFRHNFNWPFFHWETTLGEGEHHFFLPAGWNKFQVRLNSGLDPDATVLWVL